MTDAKSSYTYNSMLVKALLRVTPHTSLLEYAQSWIDTLDSMSKSDTELSMRSDYMWYMLKCLQCGSLSIPFNGPPPSRPHMKPLYEVLPSAVYEEVVKKDTRQMSWLDQLSCQNDLDGVDRGVCPSKFFPSQPLPRYGTVCYGCVFGAPQDPSSCLE